MRMVQWFNTAVVGLALLASPVGVGNALGEPAGAVPELLRAQTELIERTREYRESLEPVLAFQEAEAARAEAQARSNRDLLARGAASRPEVEALDALAQASRARVDETRQRLSEADAPIVETRAAMADAAKIPPSFTRKLPYQATVLSLKIGCVSEESEHKYIEYRAAGDNVAADKIIKAYCTRFREGDPVIVLGDNGRRMRVKRPGELVEYFSYGFEQGSDRWHDGKPWPRATKPPKR